MKQNATLQLALFLVVSMMAASAHALPVLRIKTEPARSTISDEPLALEVAVAQPTNTAELAEAEAWVEKDFEAARTQNPNARFEVVLAEPDNSGNVDISEIPAAELKTAVRTKLKRWLFKHGRISFTVIRGMASTGVATWGLLLAPHVTIPAALAAGVAAGAMSAGLMYFNKNYQDWLLKSKSVAGRTARFALTNVIYMAVTKFMGALTGMPTEPTLAAAAQNVLTASLLGTFAQGTWSLGIAMQSKRKLERAKAEGSLSADKTVNIEVGNNVATLSISMISTALSVAKMVGVPFTDIGMVAMGAAGSVYYGVNLMHERKWTNEKLAEAVRVEQCQESLTP